MSKPSLIEDAEILECAAEILRKSDLQVARDAATVCEFRAGGLRAASAPKPVDVFGEMARIHFGGLFDQRAQDLAATARDWFDPLVEALERIEAGSSCPHSSVLATDALSALRRKPSAKGAGTARSEGPERKAQEAGQ